MYPQLVILAAGSASRFGGNKQFYPIGPNGESLIEYSIFDAIRAGFNAVIVVVSDYQLEEAKQDLKKAGTHVGVEFCVQASARSINPKRTKPWGTGHALLSARDQIQDPFAVINADDLYGLQAYQIAGKFLKSETVDNALIGYTLGETLSEFGSVSRGICEINDGYLSRVQETINIGRTTEGIQGTSIDRRRKVSLEETSPISTGFWCFQTTMLSYLAESFDAFLNEHSNDLDREFYIPTVVEDCLRRGVVKFKYLPTSSSQWEGMTYKEDVKSVSRGIADQIDAGNYPSELWS